MTAKRNTRKIDGEASLSAPIRTISAETLADMNIDAGPDVPTPNKSSPDLAAIQLLRIQDQQSSKVMTVSDLKPAFDFTADIIDKQYRSYIWNDGKVQALVTMDTALIAGILLILQTFNQVPFWTFIPLAFSFLFLLSSFLFCLVHAIPKIHSGIGNEDNLRTMVGITCLEKEKYHEKVTALNLEDMVRMNCWQISGMCKNNLRSHQLIRRGVRLTISGVVAIVIALPIIIVSDRKQRNKPTVLQQPVAGYISASPPKLQVTDKSSADSPSSATSANRPHNQLKSTAGTK